MNYKKIYLNIKIEFICLHYFYVINIIVIKLD